MAVKILTPEEAEPYVVLDLELIPSRNDVSAKTVREYLKALLGALWIHGADFNAARPFGHAAWQDVVNEALVRAKLIKGKLDGMGYIDEIDDEKALALVCQAIGVL